MAEGVVDATVGTVERHPYIVGGAIVVAIVALWALSAKKAKAPQAFSFSYGPSDAQVQAGTQLAIAQAGDQAALSIANLNATTSTAQLNTKAGVVGDYFAYLAQAGKAAADTTTATANYAYLTTLANDQAVTTLGTLSANNVYAKQQQDYSLGAIAQGNLSAKQQQDYALGLTTAGLSYNATINGQNQATVQKQIDATTQTQKNNLDYSALINQQLVDQNKNAYDYSTNIASIFQSGYNITASKG